MTRGSLPIRQTQCLKNPSKVWILTQMERMQMYSFGPIWSPIYCRKTKILLKTKISGKLSSLGISNKISPRSQKKSHNSCKINQNKLFGPKLGINCSLRPRQRIIRNSHIAYNMTIHLYFLDAKFHFLDICWRPDWPHFLIFYFILFHSISFFGHLGRGGGFRDNNFSKQCQIERKFCPQVVLIVVQMIFKRFWKALVFTENFKSTQSFKFSVQLRPQFTSWRWPKPKITIRLSK